MEIPFLEIPEEQYPFPQNGEEENALELFDNSYLQSLTATAQSVSPNEKYLIFTSGGQTFAVSLYQVAEVCRSLAVTPIPGVPDWMTGVTNLRGELLAVIDPETDRNSNTIKTKIIVLAGSRRRNVGLLVDEVKEIVQLPPSAIGSFSISGSVPGEGLTAFSRGSSEYREAPVVILDTEKILVWSKMNELHGQ
jgi:purine-binding chemotaxis protein CheW